MFIKNLFYVVSLDLFNRSCAHISTIYFLTRFIWESNCYCPERHNHCLHFTCCRCTNIFLFPRYYYKNKFYFLVVGINSFCFCPTLKLYSNVFNISKGIKKIDLSKLMSHKCNLWCNLKVICCIY